jgi:hypothetical protein
MRFRTVLAVIAVVVLTAGCSGGSSSPVATEVADTFTDVSISPLPSTTAPSSTTTSASDASTPALDVTCVEDDLSTCEGQPTAIRCVSGASVVDAALCEGGLQNNVESESPNFTKVDTYSAAAEAAYLSAFQTQYRSLKPYHPRLSLNEAEYSATFSELKTYILTRGRQACAFFEMFPVGKEVEALELFGAADPDRPTVTVYAIAIGYSAIRAATSPGSMCPAYSSRVSATALQGSVKSLLQAA